MCGIIGYIGEKNAKDIIIAGLKKLEYRGYDSAGIAIINDKKEISIAKKQGNVTDLEKYITTKQISGTIGIGHTRWATHGEPNDINAHPHYSTNKKIVLIHNGIIENYTTLKTELEKQGHKFYSETDSEVLANLIDNIREKAKVDFLEAVRLSLQKIIGAYAILVIDKENPDMVIAAKKSSPLVIGLGKKGEYFLASDSTPLIEHTRNVIYLEDNEIAVFKKNKELYLIDIFKTKQIPYIHELEGKLDNIEKSGYDYFMLKEIHEQPTTVANTLRGRINISEGRIQLGGLADYMEYILKANKIVIIACGTSWHAGLVGEYLIEEYARIPVEVEYASEFRYRNPIIKEKDIVIAISQSGETADTIAAINLAKKKGAIIIGICNVVGSTISRITHTGSYTHAGPEIGVASTKAFTSQVTLLTLLAILLGKSKNNIASAKFHRLLIELNSLPQKINQVLKLDNKIKEIAIQYANAKNFLYLGRGYNFPVALEGALKLKEISYIHAEGYPAAEMKHGPIALIDEAMPVVVIAPRSANYDKIVSNIQEVKARKGKIIAIISEGDEEIQKFADHTIKIPIVEESLSPILTTIPLQLISYHITVCLGKNVDQPRNLAKSVTVE